FIFWGLVRGKKENQEPALIQAASERLGALWMMLDGHLARRDFVAGNRFTMGDIPLGAFVWRWTNLDIERPACEHVEAWHERLKQRPAFRKHVMIALS
ncbi:MAG: glutathione binding-like protein, partial [Gammaproteobacteria bacterium]